MQQGIPLNTRPPKMALSVAEAAQLIGVSKPTVYLLCKREDFPSIYVGGRLLISRRGLEAWIDQQAKAVG